MRAGEDCLGVVKEKKPKKKNARQPKDCCGPVIYVTHSTAHRRTCTCICALAVSDASRQKVSEWRVVGGR